jgi:hypothetical protein
VVVHGPVPRRYVQFGLVTEIELTRRTDTDASHASLEARCWRETRRMLFQGNQSDNAKQLRSVIHNWYYKMELRRDRVPKMVDGSEGSVQAHALR